ncbi:MAG: DUF6159 family protein [Anaerolineae bacterium]
MFKTFSRSWELVKASYAVLRQDKELLWFPVISTIGVIFVSIVFSIPLFISGLVEAISSGGEPTGAQTVIGLVIAFAFYFVMYTIIIFSNTALIGAAMIRLNGGDPTVQDGFRIASERINAILGYAAISATVGVILSAIRDEDNILSQIFAGILETAWNLIVFMVVPVLVVENVGPIEAIKRSTSLLKRTWGEQLTGTFSMGLIFGLLTFAAILVIGLPVILLASATSSPVIMVLGVIIVILVVMGISLFGSALNGIFQAALYRYATEGQAGEFFDESMLAGAFRHK